MKRIALLLLIIGLRALLPVLSYGQHQLEVEIINLRNDTGEVLLEVLNPDQELIIQKEGVIENGNSTLFIEGLDEGVYAVRYFHDENSNKKLDTNVMGIPKEGYGFSNNAYSAFGPKGFEEWLFPVQSDTTITLITTY
ncbi:DUF2141 domain-containing protein [Balneolaceae bacterium ANBcel3]|nr:DUF2141 domain-containing protein [Balneolaceae bacterium ANBcel3]